MIIERDNRALSGCKAKIDVSFIIQRYERCIDATNWSSLRKGAVFGLYTGWVYLIVYMIYSVGFIFGSILTYQQGHKLSISDILAVSATRASYQTSLFIMHLVLTQIVITFTQGIAMLGFLGAFLQTVAEARGAISPVFSLLDEVRLDDEY